MFPVGHNPAFSPENFLVPAFPLAWPFSTLETEYLKGWLSLLFGLLLVLAWMYRRRRGRPHPAERGGLIVAALVGLAAFTNVGTFHGPTNPGPGPVVHGPDQFHYTMGLRYFPELGYTGLYPAALLALHVDAPDPLAELDAWVYRDMRTYHLAAGRQALDEVIALRERFTPERWQAFVRDVGFWAGYLGEDRLRGVFLDHGFNPGPIYVLVGRILLPDTPLSHGLLVALSLIDPLLMVVGLAVLGWGLGWRAPVLVVLLVGLLFPAQWAWVGGAFLRYGWLAALLTGIGLAGKGRYVATGLCFGLAAGLRSFPGFLLVGLAIPFLAEVARRYRAGQPVRPASLWSGHRSGAYLRTVSGAAGVLLLLGVGATLSAGADSWAAWNEKVSLHDSRFSPNSIGLASAVMLDPSVTAETVAGQPDANRVWDAGKRTLLAERLLILLGAVVGLFTLTVWTLRRTGVIATVVLGIAWLYGTFTLSGYYYSFLALVPLAFLCPVADRERGWSPVLLATGGLLLANTAQIWAWQRYGPMDFVFGHQSLLLGGVLTVVLVGMHVRMAGTGPAQVSR
ncbi:MAG: hypothetical protein ACFE0O_11195 [Opitutales bacterium]